MFIKQFTRILGLIVLISLPQSAFADGLAVAVALGKEGALKKLFDARREAININRYVSYQDFFHFFEDTVTLGVLGPNNKRFIWVHSCGSAHRGQVIVFDLSDKVVLDIDTGCVRNVHADSFTP